MPDDHPHAAIARRLKRANGHLETIAQQLQAVESAIESAKKALIHDHIGHGLEETLKASGPKGRSVLRDFRLIAKYL